MNKEQVETTMGEKEPDQSSAAELLDLTSSDSPYGALTGFTIDKKIGKGQFSVVYRARAIHDQKTVALKKVQIFEMMDSKARLDCMKEIQLLQVMKTWSMVEVAMFSYFSNSTILTLSSTWLPSSRTTS